MVQNKTKCLLSKLICLQIDLHLLGLIQKTANFKSLFFFHSETDLCSSTPRPKYTILCSPSFKKGDSITNFNLTCENLFPKVCFWSSIWSSKIICQYLIVVFFFWGGEIAPFDLCAPGHGLSYPYVQSGYLLFL